MPGKADSPILTVCRSPSLLIMLSRTSWCYIKRKRKRRQRELIRTLQRLRTLQQHIFPCRLQWSAPWQAEHTSFSCSLVFSFCVSYTLISSSLFDCCISSSPPYFSAISTSHANHACPFSLLCSLFPPFSFLSSFFSYICVVLSTSRAPCPYLLFVPLSPPPLPSPITLPLYPSPHIASSSRTSSLRRRMTRGTSFSSDLSLPRIGLSWAITVDRATRTWWLLGTGFVC